ncbi:MAG: hypothetical protein KDA45_11835, partial [Planctomycetales bacterium]|nr:hypothetical protein [Planctomycetales bacterium]
MTTQDLPETHWQTIARLLRSEDGGLRGVYPDASRRLSLLDALSDENVAVTAAQAQSGREIGHRLHALLDQLAAFENLSRCPILAITGLLNAGKSSLLATYLSPQNQARVLRGLDNRAGTHRFVLWLPQVWAEQPELLMVLVDFLTALFGHAPEQLAEDPQLAAMQYNGHIEPQALLPTAATEKPATEPVVAEPVVAERAGGVDPLSVPLLAYDTALDELRMGLIDCPDIQTGFFSASGDVE